MKSDFQKKIKKILFSTLNCLKKNESYINSLNVFPVPDGDTGSNMFMTLNEAIEKCKDTAEGEFVKCIIKKIVLSAHGNSGILFSQFLKGFLETVRDREGTLKVLKDAFKRGVKNAYKVIDNPKEGTILTVMRKASEAIDNSKNIIEAVTNSFKIGVETLKETPKLLPILSEAGVFDAGGEGFICFLKSLYEIYTGKPADRDFVEIKTQTSSVWKKVPEFENCLEVEVKIKKSVVKDLKEKLRKFGNSILFVKNHDYLKVHIHTNESHRVINFLKRFGDVQSIINRNMRKEHWEFIFGGDSAIVTFSYGKDTTEMFHSLGSSVVIDVNSSIRNIKNIIFTIPVGKILILPIEKYTLSRLKRTKWKEGKDINIVESKSIPEVIEALLNFDSTESFENNLKKMRTSIKNIKSGYIGKDSEDGKYKLVYNGRFRFKGTTLFNTLKYILEKEMKYRRNLTIIFGKNIEKRDTEKILESIKRHFPEFNLYSLKLNDIKKDLIFGLSS